MSYWLAFALVGALAEDPTLNSPPAQTATQDSIVVIGEKPIAGPVDLAGAVDLLSREQLEYEHVDDTLELFAKVPGVYFSRFNQGIINSDVAIRGFAGDGSTPHAKLLIDGIPANLHNGYGELDQLFPMAMDGIAVYKGTSDARFGLHNVAGSYSVETRHDLERQIELSFGSWEGREVQAYFGGARGRLIYSVFGGFRESEGYRAHTSLEKHAGVARLTWAPTDTWSFGLIARASGYQGDSPGYLTRSEARRSPRSSAPYANLDGGDKALSHVSLHLDGRFDQGATWSAKIYGQAFERERWVRFNQAAALQNRFDDQDHAGVVSTLVLPFGERFKLTWGVDFEQQDNIEQRFGTLGQSRERDPARVLRNFEYDFETTGSFVQLGAELEKLTINLALRADRLDGEFVSISSLGVRTPRAIFEFGTILQPKFNLLFAASEKLTLFANLGRTFQHPFGADAFTTGVRTARDVSYNDGFEVGAKWRPNQKIEVRGSVWRQKASDEFVVVDGNSQNVGETDRRGFDLGANFALTERVYLWANYGQIDSEIVRAASAQRLFEGNRLRSIPDFTGSVGLSVVWNEVFRSTLHFDTQGDYELNEANLGLESGGYSLVNASLHYDTGRFGLVSLHLNNLLDEYYEYAFDFGQAGLDTIHSPGDGFNASLSVRFSL